MKAAAWCIVPNLGGGATVSTSFGFCVYVVATRWLVCRRYLYVNSRPWPKGYRIEDPTHPPPIAQEIDIHVIDLSTMSEVGTMHRSHKAYTPNNECFFIFLDVCDEYVARSVSTSRFVNFLSCAKWVCEVFQERKAQAMKLKSFSLTEFVLQRSSFGRGRPVLEVGVKTQNKILVFHSTWSHHCAVFTRVSVALKIMRLKKISIP